MDSRHTDHNVWASPIVVSFLVGAASSSLVCWWTFGSTRRGSDAADPESSEFPQDEKPSWMLRSFNSMEDLTSRIGELPARTTRMHWPWNKSRTTTSSIPNRVEEDTSETDEDRDDAAGASHTNPDDESTSSTSSHEKKTGPCIGSIFGLDVGGTLAKLVYFEQGTTEDHSALSHQQLVYNRAASAQVVLEARREQEQRQQHGDGGADGQNERVAIGSTSVSPLRLGPRRRSSTTEIPTPKPQRPPFFYHHQHRHSMDSDHDLQQLYRMRQESVPAHLSEYGSLREPTSERADQSQTRRQNGDDHNRKESDVDQTVSDGQSASSTAPANGKVKKSRSMLDMTPSSRDHAEALDRFYSFARRLDTYETTVKDKNLSFFSRQLGGEFHFIQFETRQMHNAMDLIRVNKLHLNIVEMGATGGGAHKYAADWDRMLGIQIVKQQELDSLVAGMQFVLSTVVGECYTYRPKLDKSTPAKSASGSRQANKAGTKCGGMQHPQQRAESPSPDPSLGMSLDDGSDDCMEEPPSATHDGRGDVKTMIDGWWYSRKVQRDVVSYSSTYPYLLVTIGTGVSILRVHGPRKHTRVSGSTIGGGTYWGLIRLLTDVETFEDAMSLAGRGDPSKVDMMVGDIYGNNVDALEKLGLPSDLVASSFGKLVTKADPASGLKQEDLARALLLMVTINIGQVAYLNAQLHKTPRIYFVGNFLRNNTISQRRLSYAIDYWSKGEMEALFLEHEGYFGALGAFLLSQGVTNDEDGLFQRPPMNTTSSHSKNGGGASASDETSQHRRITTMNSLL